MTDDNQPDVGLDLDRERAVRREAGSVEEPIRFGGQVIATLPAELPLDVLAPIRDLDLDLALLVRSVMQMASTTDDAASQREATNLVIDLLVSNPELPKQALTAAEDTGRRLLGEDGYAAFLAQRPSHRDVGALLKWVFAKYGITLGEASPSSESSGTGGGTSSAISSGSTESTPAAPSPVPEQQAS